MRHAFKTGEIHEIFSSVSCLQYSSILKMHAICYCESSVESHRTTYAISQKNVILVYCLNSIRLLGQSGAGGGE
jgi:hypothetical protein